MAPLTRAHRARAETTGEEIEPLSPALTTNTLTPIHPPSRNNHLRFDEKEEEEEEEEEEGGDDTPTIIRRGGIDTDDMSTQLNGHQAEEIADSQDDGGSNSDSDDDAPEAVSMDVSKQEAEKRKEDTRRATEAQKEATRKKRKERDTILKTQKAASTARKESKRQKLDPEATTTHEAPVISEKETEPTPGKQRPPLLPESLLAKVSSNPAAVDDDSDSDSDSNIQGAPIAPVVSSRLEKNRRRREQKKRNKVLKKGVVNVKVLKDEVASRKIMAPPASKRVENVKETWLFTRRKGGVERRSVGGGFVKRK